MIDPHELHRMAEYFRFRWDPPVLAQLAIRPSRFRALASRLENQLGEHLDDNALSRSLRRLTRLGLVAAEGDRIGGRDVKVYQLTLNGLRRVEIYLALVAVFPTARGPYGQPESADPANRNVLSSNPAAQS